MLSFFMSFMSEKFCNSKYLKRLKCVCIFFVFLACKVIGNSPRRRVNVNFPFNTHNEAVHLYSLCSYAKRKQITVHDFLKRVLFWLCLKKNITL